MPADDRLPPAALAFLADLAAHNERAWFDAQRERCERDLVEPARALVRRLLADLAQPFPRITGSDAKSGGSVTRLHRDTRFGKDKRPYHSRLRGARRGAVGGVGAAHGVPLRGDGVAVVGAADPDRWCRG